MSIEKETIGPTKFFAPYTGFLADKLNKIYEVWDQGDPERALNRLFKLYFFLKTDWKRVLEPKMVVVREKMQKAYGVQGPDWFSRQQNRNRVARRIAQQELPPLLDILTDLLDQAGFLGATKRKVPEGHE